MRKRCGDLNLRSRFMFAMGRRKHENKTRKYTDNKIIGTMEKSITRLGPIIAKQLTINK